MYRFEWRWGQGLVLACCSTVLWADSGTATALCDGRWMAGGPGGSVRSRSRYVWLRISYPNGAVNNDYCGKGGGGGSKMYFIFSFGTAITRFEGELHLTRKQFSGDLRPIDERCECLTCRSGYSRAFLNANIGRVFLLTVLKYYALFFRSLLPVDYSPYTTSITISTWCNAYARPSTLTIYSAF